MTPPHGVPALPSPHTHPTPCTGAYVPVYLTSRDKLAGGSGRSLTFVLGNMLSAGASGWRPGCLAVSLLLRGAVWGNLLGSCVCVPAAVPCCHPTDGARC